MYIMASQPLTGVNQQPLVFAQIRNGSTSEVIKARIVTSSRVVNIKSNMFALILQQTLPERSGLQSCRRSGIWISSQIRSR